MRVWSWLKPCSAKNWCMCVFLLLHCNASWKQVKCSGLIGAQREIRTEIDKLGFPGLASALKLRWWRCHRGRGPEPSNGCEMCHGTRKGLLVPGCQDAISVLSPACQHFPVAKRLPDWASLGSLQIKTSSFLVLNTQSVLRLIMLQSLVTHIHMVMGKCVHGICLINTPKSSRFLFLIEMRLLGSDVLNMRSWTLWNEFSYQFFPYLSRQAPFITMSTMKLL